MACFKRILKDRVNPKVEPMVDGMTGFLFLDKNDMPMVALHWEKYFQHIREKYNSIYKVQMPPITPHVCRHTFCSNMASREWIRRCFSILWDTRISVLRWIPILMLNFRMHRKIFKKQLIHNDLMKMREKWLNASIYLNPQFLTCRFPMADLPLVQTWNLPKFYQNWWQKYAKICQNMPE